MIELDISHSIRPIVVEGAIYSPHKGEEGVNLPDKLGKAMVKRGWAKEAKVTFLTVKGSELKAVAQWLKNTLTISGSKVGDNGITTHFVDAANIYGGKVFTPAEWIEGKGVFAFDSKRLTKCLWTCKKGEEIDIKIRRSTLEIRDKDGRQWLHKLPGKEEMQYIKNTKTIKTGSIKVFFSKEQLKTLKRAITEAVKEGKGDCTTYEDVVLVTEGKNINIFLHGFGSIKKIFCVYTGDKRGESVAVYSLDMFLEVLKGVKPKGKTEGLKILYDEDKALKATFKIGSSTAVVYIVGKTEERREEVREALNPSSTVEEPEAGEEELFNADAPRLEEDIKQAKAELDKIQEQEEVEHEKYLARINKAATDAAEQVEREKTAEADAKRFLERLNKVANADAVKRGEEVREEVIKEGVSFLTVREANGAAFHNSKEVYEDMKPEAQIDRECMWVLHLSGGKVLKKELVAMGKGNGAYITPREVFRRAIIEGSTKIIMVHNHPSGDPTPSEADKTICETFVKAGELLGVDLLDFIVIGTQGYTSFADKGLGGF